MIRHDFSGIFGDFVCQSFLGIRNQQKPHQSGVNPVPTRATLNWSPIKNIFAQSLSLMSADNSRSQDVRKNVYFAEGSASRAHDFS